MKTILLLNEKGGVGKTTLSVNLAAALAADGRKVLLIDGDAQGHSVFSLRLKREDGLAQLLVKGAAFNDVLRRVDPAVYGGGDGFLLVLPSADATSDIGKKDSTKVSPLQLNARLQELDSYVDYVVIDASPTISELHTSFYFAADVAFCPTHCELLSIEGLKQSIKHLKAAQEAGASRGLKVAALGGIVPSMFNGTEKVQHESLGWLKGKFDESMVLKPIHMRTAWKQAMQKRTPVCQFAPRTEAAKEAQTFFAQVMERVQ